MLCGPVHQYDGCTTVVALFLSARFVVGGRASARQYNSKKPSFFMLCLSWLRGRTHVPHLSTMSGLHKSYDRISVIARAQNRSTRVSQRILSLPRTTLSRLTSAEGPKSGFESLFPHIDCRMKASKDQNGASCDASPTHPWRTKSHAFHASQKRKSAETQSRRRRRPDFVFFGAEGP